MTTVSFSGLESSVVKLKKSARLESVMQIVSIVDVTLTIAMSVALANVTILLSTGVSDNNNNNNNSSSSVNCSGGGGVVDSSNISSSSSSSDKKIFTTTTITMTTISTTTTKYKQPDGK